MLQTDASPVENKKKFWLRHCTRDAILMRNQELTRLSLQTNKQRLLFLAAKGWIKSTCTRKHTKEIHTNMSNTANVIDNWL